MWECCVGPIAMILWVTNLRKGGVSRPRFVNRAEKTKKETVSEPKVGQPGHARSISLEQLAGKCLLHVEVESDVQTMPWWIMCIEKKVRLSSCSEMWRGEGVPVLSEYRRRGPVGSEMKQGRRVLLRRALPHGDLHSQGRCQDESSTCSAGLKRVMKVAVVRDGVW